MLGLTLLMVFAMANGQYTFGEYEYFISKTSAHSYTEAENNCTELNASLVVIYNSSVQEFLKTTIQSMTDRLNAYWIGLKRSEDGNFLWTDGSSLEFNGNWNNGEPNNVKNNENCVIMGFPSQPNFFKWFDVNCDDSFYSPDPSSSLGFICQKQEGATLSSTLNPLITPSTTTSSTTKQELQTNQNEGLASEEMPENLTIIFPVVVGTLLIVIVIIAVAFIVRRKLNRNSKSLTGNGISMGDAGTYNEIRTYNETGTYNGVGTYEPTPIRTLDDTNVYDLPVQEESTKQNGRLHDSSISLRSEDSFDDEPTIEEVKYEPSKVHSQYDEDTYCSVNDVMDNPTQNYVPFEVLEKQQDHTYSVANPPNSTVLTGRQPNSEYDALASTT